MSSLRGSESRSHEDWGLKVAESKSRKVVGSWVEESKSHRNKGLKVVGVRGDGEGKTI